ncbi:MAG: hypothetical protein ACLFNS_08360 [Desulfobacterales bacterium]
MREKMENNDAGVLAEKVRRALEAAASDGDLSCAAAFEVAGSLKISPAAVGEYADEFGFHLTKCQLGLFGYLPHKKIAEPLASVDSELAEAIREGLVNDRLPCKTAWEIAERFDVPRMTVSAACETLGIKIKPCQIGAF